MFSVVYFCDDVFATGTVASGINVRSRKKYFPVGNTVFLMHNTVYKMLFFVVIASIHSVIKHNFTVLTFESVYISQRCSTVYYIRRSTAAKTAN